MQNCRQPHKSQHSSEATTTTYTNVPAATVGASAHTSPHVGPPLTAVRSAVRYCGLQNSNPNPSSKSKALATPSSTMPFIQEEIISEILRRLPVKALLLFRSVSKSWRCLIDGRGFVQMHLRHSLESNSSRTLLVESSRCRVYCVDLDYFKLLQVGDSRIEPSIVIASCEGLVLVVLNPGHISMWNPATRKHHVLPAHPPIPDRLVSAFVQSIFALGYDTKRDDYKVVRVVQNAHYGDGGGFSTETTIYSLNSNCWEKGKDFPYLLPLYTSRWGIHLHGKLHPIAMQGGKREAMMAFDLGEDEHHELPMPPYRRAGADPSLASAEVLGGCLAAVISGKKSYVIWLMKEYGVKQSWMKLLQFDLPIEGLCMDLRPLVYSKNGEEVLLYSEGSEGMCLNWYNLRKKSVTIACVSGLNASFNIFFDPEVCVGSLVSPFPPAAMKN